MTKKDYLRALQKEIQALPHSEQKEALEYYENYFEDAGIENEQKVIEELGDAKELAKEILSNVAGLPQKVEAKKERIKSDSSMPSSVNKWLLAIILVLTFPVWINIVAALFGIIVSLLAIGFSGIIAAIAIFIAALATICVSVWAFTASPLVALFILGTCFILIAIGIFVWIIGLWFFAKFVPWIWDGIKNLYNSIKHKIKTKI